MDGSLERTRRVRCEGFAAQSEVEAAACGQPAVVLRFPDRPCVSLDAMWPRFYVSTEVIRVVRARIGTLGKFGVDQICSNEVVHF